MYAYDRAPDCMDRAQHWTQQRVLLPALRCGNTDAACFKHQRTPHSLSNDTARLSASRTVTAYCEHETT